MIVGNVITALLRTLYKTTKNPSCEGFVIPRYFKNLEDQGTIINTSQEDFETLNNYKYDEEGRLIQDLAEGIEEIVWRVDGKVKKVIFTSASTKNNLEFDYDAFGRRIAKHVYLQDNSLVRSTYYILDAQGNQLNTYEHSATTEDVSETYSFELAERVIYGSSRLGINVNKVDLLDENSEEIISLELGNKLYEMSNHLGNVLTVINDIKVPYLEGSDVAYYATIVSTADYSPFGVQLDGRTVSAESYRYGFQGQEKDDEIKGAGNSVNYTFRMHDPRLGRFFAVDPIAACYPELTPFQHSSLSPIWMREIEGLEGQPFQIGSFDRASVTLTYVIGSGNLMQNLNISFVGSMGVPVNNGGFFQSNNLESRTAFSSTWSPASGHRSSALGINIGAAPTYSSHYRNADGSITSGPSTAVGSFGTGANFQYSASRGFGYGIYGSANIPSLPSTDISRMRSNGKPLQIESKNSILTVRYTEGEVSNFNNRVINLTIQPLPNTFPLPDPNTPSFNYYRDSDPSTDWILAGAYKVVGSQEQFVNVDEYYAEIKRVYWEIYDAVEQAEGNTNSDSTMPTIDDSDSVE